MNGLHGSLNPEDTAWAFAYLPQKTATGVLPDAVQEGAR